MPRLDSGCGFRVGFKVLDALRILALEFRLQVLGFWLGLGVEGVGVKSRPQTKNP